MFPGGAKDYFFRPGNGRCLFSSAAHATVKATNGSFKGVLPDERGNARIHITESGAVPLRSLSRAFEATDNNAPATEKGLLVKQPYFLAPA